MVEAILSVLRGRVSLGSRSLRAVLGNRVSIRPFSNISCLRNQSANSDEIVGANDRTLVTKASDTSELPWYMRENVSSKVPERRKVELPEVPSQAPAEVSKFLRLVGEEYGLFDIKIFDMVEGSEEKDSLSTQNIASYIIICSGKSEKHNLKAAMELRHFIKHNYNTYPRIEGMVLNHRSPIERRRLARRARKGLAATDNDYGKAPNNWIMCDTGVDDIFIHIMTENRRKELDLESIWTGETELIEDDEVQARSTERLVSDNIFSSIRRNFHTMSPFTSQRRNYSFESGTIVEVIKKDLVCENVKLSDRKLKVYHDRINSLPTKTVIDHNNKIDLLSIIHLLSATSVSFEDVLSSIYQKYGSLALAMDSGSNLENERMKDTIKVICLLIDSNEAKQVNANEEKQYIDRQFSQLSRFISTLYGLSGQQIEPLANPQFFPLLWRLSYLEKTPEVINGETVNDFIYNRTVPSNLPSDSSIIQAGNRSRDIADLIDYTHQKKGYRMSPSFSELILFTYGNAGKWPKFWRQWDSFSTHFQDSKTNSSNLTRKWVILASYIAIRNDKSAMLHFLNHYWSGSTSVALCFTDDYIASNYNFSSEKERDAFKNAMRMIMDTIRDENGQVLFPKVEQFVDKMI